MIIHKDSHTDHAITPDQWAHITERFADRGAFFIETIELPEHLGTVMNGLYGPSCGDAPVPESEVYYARRGKPGARAWDSRMVKMPPRPTRFVRVVAGPHKEECSECKGKGTVTEEALGYRTEEVTCTACRGFGGTMFDCVLYTAYGVSSPDMPAAPKEPGDLELQLAALVKKMQELNSKLNTANFVDRDDEDTVGAELVECAKQNEKLHKDLAVARAFWKDHGLAEEVAQ